METEVSQIVYDRMASIIATRKSSNDFSISSKKVYNFPFALVTPLGTH